MKSRIIGIILAIALVMGNCSMIFAETADEGLVSEGSQLVLTNEDEATGSGDEEVPEHEHIWDEGTVTKKATYFEEGVLTYHCTVEGCEEIKTEPIEKKTAYSQWVKTAGKWCYFNAESACVKKVKKTTKNKWVVADGKKFYFTEKSQPVRAGIEYYKYKYGTFILVDLSDQQLSYYKDQELKFQFNVITGTNKKESTRTPTGKYRIGYKCKNTWLIGPGYKKKVKYWIAFISNEYGIHDASWRDQTTFDNPDEYLTNGSLGCVIMRTTDIAKLYKKVKAGDMMIIRK